MLLARLITQLCVSDTAAGANAIRVWDVTGETLNNGRQFASIKLDGVNESGHSDGIRSDMDDNIWSSAGWVGAGYGGVHVFAPNVDRIGQILLPEVCANLCFGGNKRNRLVMVAPVKACTRSIQMLPERI